MNKQKVELNVKKKKVPEIFRKNWRKISGNFPENFQFFRGNFPAHITSHCYIHYTVHHMYTGTIYTFFYTNQFNG